MHRVHRSCARLLMCAAAGALLAGGVLAQAPDVPAADACLAAYIIGADDVLDVAVWESTAVSRVVAVRPDGKISLPLVNDLQAAGLTPMQLRDAIAKALTPYIPDASVSVLVKEIHSFKVSVIGQVRTPGRFELKDRATVLDVLAMAGGFTEYASRDRTMILREGGGRREQIPFPYGKVAGRSEPRADAPRGPGNLCLRPGDVVVVP